MQVIRGCVICFYFSFSYSHLLGNKLFYVAQVKYVLPVVIAGERCHSVLFSAQERFVMFFLPHHLRRGGIERRALLGTLSPTEVNPPRNFLQYSFESALEKEERQGHQLNLQKTVTIQLC